MIPPPNSTRPRGRLSRKSPECLHWNITGAKHKFSGIPTSPPHSVSFFKGHLPPKVFHQVLSFAGSALTRMSSALERQIRPIYGMYCTCWLSNNVYLLSFPLLDALDTQSNKSAVLACNKVLKKHPNNVLVKVIHTSDVWPPMSFELTMRFNQTVIESTCSCTIAKSWRVFSSRRWSIGHKTYWWRSSDSNDACLERPWSTYVLYSFELGHNGVLTII